MGSVLLGVRRCVGFALVAVAMASVLGLVGCRTIKPWEKEYLLSPLMDDGALAQLQSPFRAATTGAFEKLASSGGGASSGAACPTCGG